MREKLGGPADEAAVDEHLGERAVACPFFQHVETLTHGGVAHAHGHDAVLDALRGQPRHHFAHIGDA
jgi:hypothetical protein